MTDEAATASKNEEQVRANSSTRASCVSQKESATPKKKRGRPRFEIHDGSVADVRAHSVHLYILRHDVLTFQQRRRTQIREAQRAYRQRKESTLAELRTRISELTGVIEHMNKAFLDCCHQLTASGLSAKSMHDIQETSAQFRALTKSVCTPSEQHDLETATTACQISSASTATDADENLSHEPSFIPLDITMVNAEYACVSDNDITVDWTSFDQRSEHLSSGLHHQSILDRVSSMPPSIDPPVTYNFQETTFGRRLHRSCMEQSYQLILDPDRRPAMYQQVFELSLQRRGRSNLTSALKSTLSKGSHECLLTSLPLIHIGGAGTHYPRRDSYGNLRPKMQAYNLGKIGPQMLALLEYAALQNLTSDMTVDLLGYEGEWLDPYDVEGYLNEKGIFIDPSSSFAEVEVALPLPAPCPISSTGNRLSGASTDSFVHYLEPTQAFEQHNAMGPAFDALRGSRPDDLRALPSGQEKKITVIDVTRFINRE